MRIFFNIDDHFDFLEECVRARPKRVIITTYGLFAGILGDGRDMQEWGPKYRTRTRDLLEEMRSLPDIRIITGIYARKSCKGKVQCVNCDKSWVMDLLRLVNHADKFSEFKWRFQPDFHLKSTLFSYDSDHPAPLRGIVGGRNFNDSKWADATVELDKMSALLLEKETDKAWLNATPLTIDNITKLVEANQIPEEVLNLIVS
jgi:hypothetical protein